MKMREKTKKIDKRLKHEHIHLKSSDQNIKAKSTLSNITLDYRHVHLGKQPCGLNLSVKASSVRILVPSEWYVKIKGQISLTLLDNYTETYKKEKADLELNISSFGGKILVINEFYDQLLTKKYCG